MISRRSGMLWVTPRERTKIHYIVSVLLFTVKVRLCTSDNVVIQSVLHLGQGLSSCSPIGNQLQIEMVVLNYVFSVTI